MATVGPDKVKRLWKKGIKAQQRQINDFWHNSVFLADEQWTAINKNTNQLGQIPRRDPERVRLVTNVLRPRTRGILTRLLAQPMPFRVRPQAADDETVQGAGTAEMVLDHYSEFQDWEMLRDDLMNVTWIGGTGGLCLEWDPTAGDPMVRGDGFPLSNASGRKLYTGDVLGSVVSVAEMTVAPGTRNAERAPWWVKVACLPPEQVQEMYRLENPPKADAGPMLTPELWKVMDSQGDTNSAARQLTAIFTYFERPTNEGDGQVVVVVGDQVVESSEWPFPFKDRLNLFITRETLIHGRWTGDTILTTARQPQMALNQSWSSIVEHMKRCGNARTWIPEGALDDVETLTDEPGEFATYNAALGKPMVVSPPQMPTWWIQQPDRLTALIDEQLGSVEVSRGVAPRNVESGLGLSILSENANSPLSQLAKEESRVFSRFATCVLQTLEAKVTETRSAKFAEVPDLALPAQTVDWTGASFRGQTTASVPLDAVLPRSEAQQRAWADMAYQNNAISLRVYSRIIQVPGQAEIESIAEPDVSRAQRENFLMAQGRSDVAVQLWDDDQKHLDTLNDYRKSQAFERLDPQVKQLFQAHAEAHEQASITKAAQAAQRAQVDPALAGAATAHGGPTGIGPVAPPPPAGLPAPPPEAGPPTAENALPTEYNPNDISPTPVTGTVHLPHGS